MGGEKPIVIIPQIGTSRHCWDGLSDKSKIGLRRGESIFLQVSSISARVRALFMQGCKGMLRFGVRNGACDAPAFSPTTNAICPRLIIPARKS